MIPMERPRREPVIFSHETRSFVQNPLTATAALRDRWQDVSSTGPVLSGLFCVMWWPPGGAGGGAAAAPPAGSSPALRLGNSCLGGRQHTLWVTTAVAQVSAGGRPGGLGSKCETQVSGHSTRLRRRLAP